MKKSESVTVAFRLSKNQKKKLDRLRKEKGYLNNSETLRALLIDCFNKVEENGLLRNDSNAIDVNGQGAGSGRR
mgnify:CR=1 FL=1